MRPIPSLALSALFLGLALSAPARADDPASPPTPPPPPPPPAQANPADGPDGGQHRHHMRPAFVLGELTEKLGLTPDQQRKVGAVIDGGASQAKDVRSDDSLSREDKRAKMGEIMKATRGQIRALLTPDQQKQFDAMPQRGDRPKPPPSN